MLDEILQGRRLEKYVPLIGWVTTYQRAWLRDDLVSGVVVGAIMIPVAMAYAQMAGVPPENGLYSAIIGMTVYAIFATSRHLKITTSSTMSIMSIAVVAPLVASGFGTYLALSSALAITVGIIMIALSFMKLGFISDFLSKSVMTGYIFGVALLIAISQLPKVFGVPSGTGTFFQQLGQFIANLPQTNPYALALGAGTIALILVIKRYKPLFPGALLALILGTAITGFLQLNTKYNVSVVSEIPLGMPNPTMPIIHLQAIPFLIGGAVGIVFLAVGESLGTGRAYAAKYHYEVNADQELLALGAANVGSGLFQGITIDMSLSNTASGEAAGARSQLSSLVSAGVILAVVVLFAPLLYYLPSAVLGGIVLSSILGLFNFEELKRYYAQRKTDFGLACTALVGVAASDVMTGLLFAVMLSLIMLLYRASRPYIAILGKRSSGEFGDLDRHPDSQRIPGLVILRLDAPLYFFNANVARTQILAQTTADPPPQAILLDLAASADLDIGTADMLRDLYSDLRANKIDLLFAQIRGSVRDRMTKTGLLEHIGADHLYPSIAAAVAAFQARPAPAEELPVATSEPAKTGTTDATT